VALQTFTQFRSVSRTLSWQRAEYSIGGSWVGVLRAEWRINGRDPNTLDVCATAAGRQQRLSFPSRQASLVNSASLPASTVAATKTGGSGEGLRRCVEAMASPFGYQ
jgi:hypothetical protein